MDHSRHKNSPSVMAELFGRMPHGDADFFVVRRLDMRGVKVEGLWPVIHSPIHCFLYVTHGEVLMQTGEQLQLLKAGECTALPAGQTFSVRYFDNCVGYMGGFSTGFVSDNGVNPLQAYRSLRHWGAHKVMFGEDMREYISGIFERLCRGSESGESQKVIKTCMALLLAEIEQASTLPQELARDNVHCNRFVEAVFGSCDLRVTVSDYANQLGISQDSLQKSVKRFTGKTPSEWIREAVVLQAKALLLNTDKNIGEISAIVGVEDPAYFSRLFKKHTGLTPVQFRKNAEISNNIPV